MHFFYHEMNKPSVCLYNGKRYGYIYNIQGDVMGLVDLENARHQVVKYAYDAWGKEIICTGDLADTLGRENPFRYRTYQYDEETGLYYLKSRYYNPVVGRFLNADSVLGRNLFAYCENDPVRRKDPEGTMPAMVSSEGGSRPKKPELPKAASPGTAVSGSGAVVASPSTGNSTLSNLILRHSLLNEA